MRLQGLIWVTLFGGLASAASNSKILSPDGYGPVHFGDRLALVEKALGEKAVRMNDDEEEACNYVRFASFPGVAIMAEAGVVTRLDVHDANIENSAKLKVGTSLAVARKMHPKISVKKNAYDSKAHDLVLKTADGKKALLFEESGGKIISVRAGLEPAVEYIEGCL